MADPTTNLRVRISADLADIKQGLGLLRGELAKVKAQGAAALPDSNAFVTGMRRARQELVSFVGVYFSLQGARILGGIADEAKLLRNRIQQAKGDYSSILAIAQETRTGLRATVDLYTRVERSTRGQIKNQGDLLALSKATNQAVKLSYTGAAQGEAAVLQFGQALASNRLGGDELRSIMENTPRLAQAIAAGMGITIGELRKLGKESKLTTDVVTKALLSQAKVLDEEFSRVPVTIGDAFTQIRNALVDYVGRQDAATGASRKFAQQLQEIARNLPRYLDPVLKALSFMIEHIDTLAVYLGTRLALGAIVAAVSGFLKLKAAIEAARVATITLRTALALIGGPVGIAIAALAAGIYYLATRESEATKAAKAHQKAMDEVRATAALSREEAIKLAIRRREEAIASLQAAQANLKLAQSQAEVARRQREALPLGGESGGAAFALSQREGAGERAAARVAQLKQQLDEITKLMLQLGQEGVKEQLDKLDAAAAAAGDAGEEKLRGIADASKLAIDAVQRQLAELDRLYGKSQITIADYYQRKQALQLADIDAQLVQARAEAASAKSNDQQAAALAKIVELQRDRAEVAPRAAREQADAEEELTRKLGEVHLRLLEADGQTAKARAGQLEEEFRELIARLQREGDAAGVALVRKLINVEAADAQLQQFEAKMQEVMGRLQGREGTVAAQTSAGLLNPAEGERQLAVARTASLQQLQALRAEAAAYLTTLSANSPEAARTLEFLDSLDTSLAQVAASQRTFAQQATQVGIDSLSTFFTDLATGAKSFKDAFKDLVRNFVAGMAQIAARALATYLVLQLLDAIYPGLGRATAATMGAGVHHTGGIAGQAPATRRNLSPLLFGAAPRYHGGGIAGLAPDEVPAVLRKGEEILTADNPRHRNNAGQRGKVTTPVVVLGERALADALAGHAGEDLVITHVMNNLDKIRAG